MTITQLILSSNHFSDLISKQLLSRHNKVIAPKIEGIKIHRIRRKIHLVESIV